MPSLSLSQALAAKLAADTVLETAVADYLRAGTLAYSKAHPRREVTLCAAMGSTCLHVSPGGAAWKSDDYQFSLYSGGELWIMGKQVELPAFLKRVEEIDHETSARHAMGGPLRIIAKGGKIIEETTDW